MNRHMRSKYDMKKKDLRNFMIVRNGLENLFIVFKGKTDEWIMVRDAEESIESFESFDFDDNLVYKDKPLSIIEIYEAVPIEVPFDLCIQKIYEQYKPKLLWKREASPVSKKKLENIPKNKLMDYFSNIVPPYLITE